MRESKTGKKLKFILALLLALSMIVTMAGCADDDDLEALGELVGDDLQGELAQNTTHYIDNYEIAVVFDNSGSMYTGKNSMGWSRAKYAMEIFASMLNYNQRDEVPGDVLKIFPMWPVTVDGSEPDANSSEGSTEPISIESVKDIEKIHNMYTVKALGTPYSTVEAAYDDLTKSDAPERWLIILTDGKFDDMSVSDFANKTKALASEDIKVQYLGIGEAANLDSYATENFFTKKSASSDTLKSDIIEICNRIFQRDQLPETVLTSQTLTLDISMRNIIVFAQGSNAQIESLTDADGNEVEIEMDSGQRSYSKIAAGNYKDAPYDQNLSGEVVTFGPCKKGEYTLNYKDADSIQIFYTPYIDIALAFSNADGETIDMTGNKEQLYPGEFTLNYYLIDGVTKEDVTESPLIAPVEFEGGYINSQGQSETVPNGGKVVLEPDSGTFLRVKATYLDDYEITTDDRKDDYTVVIAYPPIDVELEVEQKDAWYQQKNKDEWLPVDAKLSIKGNDLSDIQLANTKLNLDFDGKELPCKIESCAGESQMKIYIGKDEQGKSVDVKNGKYKITATAEYVINGQQDKILGDDDSTKINVQSYPHWLIFALIGLGIILLIALIYWWMMHKTFPAAMYLKSNLNTNAYSIRKKAMSLTPGPGGGAITCNAKPLSAHMDRKGKKARVEVSNISCSAGVQQFSINGKTYTKTPAGFVDDSGKPLTADKKFVLKNNTLIEWKVGNKFNSGNVVFSRKDASKKVKKNKRR